MDDVTKHSLLSAVRTLLAAAGAWMATHKYIDADSVNEIIGAIMILIPILWGVWDKYRSERATKAREVVAVNAGIVTADATAGTTQLASPAKAAAIIESVGPTLPPAATIAPLTKGDTP